MKQWTESTMAHVKAAGKLSWRRPAGLLLTLLAPLMIIGLVYLLLASPRATQAADNNPNNGLRIEVLTAYNLVVDSNVNAPSTYAPTAFTVGAKFCNDSGSPMSAVTAYIGTYTNTTTFEPGVYPSRFNGDSTGFSTQHPHLNNAGTYQFEHEGGSAGAADAVRFMGDLEAGECKTQYWLLSYPQCENNTDGSFEEPHCGSALDPVWGRTNDPNDDLWLNYDIWAQTGGTTANVRRKATMRNEISAMANKIWPNGDNKVPLAYRQAIQDQLGWDTIPPEGDTFVSYPGQRVITTQGIWYDLGNVNQGFDNDGDLVPDYNAWVQPIGDPNSFDPGCFRLVKTYGLIIVKRQGGQETLIAFEDQLYFQNLPPDNTGVVGLVYYQYIAIDGACTAGLSPYQEVASGRDNEKFNADFGTGIPPLTSQGIDSAGTITKTASPVTGLTVPGGTINYTIEFSNPTTVSLGAPDLGLPIVIQDSIPEGTTYVGGSAADGNTLPAGVTTYTILYSTNNGTAWTTTEPTPANVTDIQWWLSHELAGGAGGTVTFSVTADTGSGPIFYNVAGIGLGNAQPFATDDALTFAGGNNSISGTVFEDDGNNNANPNNFGNGQLDNNEAGIENVPVTLYILVDGDYVLWATTSTNANGEYVFTDLPDAEYQIVVGELSDATHPGWTDTTGTVIDVDLTAGGDSEDNNFGFAPALTLQKNLVGPSPASEDQLVTYTIDLNNQLPGNGTAVGENCQYIFWSTPNGYVVNANGNEWVAESSTLPELNGLRSSTQFSRPKNQAIYTQNFAASGQIGAITQVEYLIGNLEFSAAFGTDTIQPKLLHNTVTTNGPIYGMTQLSGYINNPGTFTAWDITGVGPGAGGGWQWSNFTTPGSVRLILEADKSGSGTATFVYIDSLGFRVTTNQICGGDSPSSTINPLPLTDTFNAAQLEFVSADPAQTSVNTGGTSPYANTGTIYWNNLGPLYAGGTETVAVTFRVKDGTFGQMLTNTATVDNAFFSNGKPTNDAEDDAVTTINRTARIGDTVWNDNGLGGGTPGNGVQDGGEVGIPGVTVELRATTPVTIDGVTYAAGSVIMTAVTDAHGEYLFIGLPDATYTVTVDNTSLPGMVQTYDADGLGTPHQSTVNISGGVDNYVQDFGYTIPNTIIGTIWHDFDADALKELADGELPLAGWTVELTGPGCAPCTTTTDANGQYVFGNLADGNYTVTVIPPSGYTQTGESADGSAANVQTCAALGGCDNSVANIAVTGGNIYSGFDFGYYQVGPYDIGGTVYADWNSDASQQPGSEPGFAGITVTLYSESGAFIAATLTDANGNYSFTNLYTGTYKVVVNTANLPSGYSQTEDYDENGVCTTCDNQASTVVVNASTDPVNNVDFGYAPTANGQIGDTVWRDLNGDGVQSGVQETGIPGVAVWLEIDLNGDGNWTRVMTQTTDANGNYLFTGLPDGSYRVVVDDASGALPTGSGGFAFVPSTPTTHPVTIVNGNSYLDADFGFKPLAAIGDTVYWDANGNGEQDWNEEGIPGATVQLINANDFSVIYNGVEYGPGAVMATTTTADGTGNNPAGFYQFTGLPTGDSSTPYLYTVRVTSIPGNPDQTADPDRDGVACSDNSFPGMPDCDNETTVRVYPGTNFMGADFGYQPSGVIGDRVWFDFNGDGIQDANEVGIPGVVITVTNGTDTYTTTTDFDGYYSFANLPDGTWSVTFGTPAGMIATTSPITNVVSGNGSVGGSATVVLDGGVATSINGQSCTGCDLHIDTGFRYAGTSTLSGTICLDNAGAPNGECGAGNSGVGTGETALNGVTGYLYRWVDGDPLGTAELIGVTTTDANGDYNFANLPNLTGNERYIVSTGAPFGDLYLTTDDPSYNVFVTDVVSVTVPSTNTPGERDVVGAYQIIDPGNTDPNEPNNITNVDFAYLSHLILNLGDLPDSYGVTLLGENGARHVVPNDPNNRIFLGDCIDAPMPDGQPDDAANAITCHDGIVFDGDSWTDPGGIVTFTAEVTGGTGYLYAWFDWNQDGAFAGAGEFIAFGELSAGTHTLTITKPLDFMQNSAVLNMRFRIFAEPLEDLFLLPEFAFVGSAYNGEVEDYQLRFSPTAVTLATITASTAASTGLLVTMLLLIMALFGATLARQRRYALAVNRC
jgi:uncharacterized repeat protein (TIGR01451 family)